MSNHPDSSVSFDDIYLFVLIVRHKGISSAAQFAGLQRSKVSRRLQELEKALGHQLLIRTTRAIELTQQGKWLYEQASNPVNTLVDASRLMREHHLTPKGRLKVAIPPALGMTEIFSQLIEQYMKEYTEVKLEIEHHVQSLDLRRENVDLQILPSYIEPLHDDYIQQRLIQIPYSMVASSEYLALNGCPDNVAQLNDFHLLASRYNKSLLPQGLDYQLFSDDLNLLQRLAISSKA
ncbi:LysR family transcriptional regulator [uncultured Aliivibrio sp.]|uniref:LysR family transcriptional regulator n=1 Tax=uncultured Aliivibrio sp. TaxID=873085 RepID=UPI00262B2802|nr:LysR family transcriptional regulator [uncultured Aliivibrio sp.]